MGTTTLSRQAAEQAAEWLSGLTAIRGVLLFGSVARGLSDDESDIDLLVVGIDPEITGRSLRSALPAALKQRNLSLLYMTEDKLGRLFDTGPAFTEHSTP